MEFLQAWRQRLRAFVTDVLSPAPAPRPEALTPSLPVAAPAKTPAWLIWGFVAVALVIATAIAIPELAGVAKSKDYPLWWRTGTAFATGQPMYGRLAWGGMEFLYSPFAAMVFAPLAMLGKIPLYCAIVLAIAAGWFFTVRLTIKALNIADASPVLYVLPSLLLLEPIVGCFDLGQPNLTLLAICLGAIWLDYRNKGILASLGGGAMLGAAVAFKLFPILILPYWIVRGRWKAAIAGIVSFLACFFALPAVFRGWPQTVTDLETWWPAITEVDAANLAQRPWNWGYKNQSLMALVHRLLRPADTWITRDQPFHINVMDIGFTGANMACAVICAGLAGGFIWLIRRTPWADQDREVRIWGILICLVTIASPLARNYYYVWLLMPLTVLVSGLYGQRRFAQGRSRYAFGFAVAFILLSFSGFPRLFQAASPLMWAGLCIVWGLVEQAAGHGKLETRADKVLRGLND